MQLAPQQMLKVQQQTQLAQQQTKPLRHNLFLKRMPVQKRSLAFEKQGIFSRLCLLALISLPFLLGHALIEKQSPSQVTAF